MFWYKYVLGITFSGFNIAPDIWDRPRMTTIANWVDPLLFIFGSTSGFLVGKIFAGIDIFWEILVLSVIFSLFIDYLILSEISALYQQKTPIKSHNALFARIFILWRIFIPDIFIASTLAAFVTKITFSKKEILKLIFLAQALRCLCILLFVAITPI